MNAEKMAQYLAALEEELAGYKARVEQGYDVADRVKAVEAEIKRIKPAAKKAADAE